MSRPPIPPPPRGVARSRVILAAGVASSAAILGTWLLIWLIWFRADLRILAIAGDPTDLSVPISVGFQGLDAKDAAGRSEPLPIADPDRLIRRIKEYLDGRRGQTSIVYLASPAVGSFGESPGVVLAPLDIFRQVVKDDTIGGASLKKLIEVFKEARGKRLLILDVGRTQADCDAGAFGDDVIGELKRLAQPPDEALADKYRAWQRDWAGFAILCSIDEGQWSWASDRDGRSAFGHYVVEALRRRDDLARFLKVVPIQVHRWVADQRKAVQTPIVLGDRSMRFTLPPAPPCPAFEDDPRLGEPAQPIRDRLLGHYRRHAAYDRSGLAGLDPIAWRDYREAWLLAERLFRAGRLMEAQTMLARANEKEGPFQRPGTGNWPSLTLSKRVIAEPDRPDHRLRLQALETSKTVENQVARFAGCYQEARELAGRPIQDRRSSLRAPLIVQASRVRKLAEEAATAAPGGHPWIDRLVDEAGNARRQALDVLLSESEFEPVARLLKLAEAKAEDALKVARALNLANRVAADLRFLGEWSIRTRSLNRDLLERIAKQGGKLGDTLRDGDRGSDKPQPIPPLTALDAEVNSLLTDLDTLQNMVKKSADEATTWRQLDDVLSVPILDPDVRVELVNRSIAPGVSVALRLPPPAKDTKADTAVKDLGRQMLGSGVTVQEGGRKGADVLFNEKTPEELLETADPDQRPDPEFTPHQEGLAFLEGCLLTAAGLHDRAILDPLLRTGPSEIARAARKARSLLLNGLRVPSKLEPMDLVAFERAILAMPRTDPAVRVGPKFNVADARWDRAIRRFAEILREDGDGDLARSFLKGMGERESQWDDTDLILIEPASDGPLRLIGDNPTSMTFNVRTPAGHPAGCYAVLLRNRGRLRINIPEWTDPIGVDAGSTSRTIEVGRPDSTIEAGRPDPANPPIARDSIAPVVYYRGRWVVGPETPVDLLKVRPEFNVRFATRKELLANHRALMSRDYRIDPKTIVDQLNRNPYECSMYRGAETSLDAIVTYEPASGSGRRRVFASASFGGKPLPLTVKGSKDGTIEIEAGQEVTFELGRIDSSDLAAAADGPSLRFEIRAKADDRAVLQAREIKFREIDPAQYFRATAYRAGPNQVIVRVHRSRDDPIAMIIGVAASVSGSQLESIHYEKNGKLERVMLDRQMAGRTPSMPTILPHDESVVFEFAVPLDFDLDCRAEIANNLGLPWHLEVKPSKIKAQGAPRLDPAAQPPKPDGAGPEGPRP